MDVNQLYQELKDLADKLQIRVSEHNFRSTGVKARSGLCKVKGEWIYVMDKHKSIRKKTNLLARCLSGMSHEEFYVVPEVRELLKKSAKVPGDVAKVNEQTK